MAVPLKKVCQYSLKFRLEGDCPVQEVPLHTLQLSHLIYTDAPQTGWGGQMEELTAFGGVDETGHKLLHHHSGNESCLANPQCISGESLWATLLS